MGREVNLSPVLSPCFPLTFHGTRPVQSRPDHAGVKPARRSKSSRGLETRAPDTGCYNALMPGISESARSSKRNTPTELNAGDIARLARPVFERHNIERAILFGSFATGRQTRKSDVDLILVQKTARRYFERFEGLLQDLYRVIPGREIECFIYTPEELASIVHRFFIRRALDEGRVIYEHG